MSGTAIYSQKQIILKKATIPDKSALRKLIFENPVPPIYGNNFEISLTTAFTSTELTNPVRNQGCISNVICYWDLGELLSFIEDNCFYDATNAADMVYFCPNCQKGSFDNKRNIKAIYYDKHLAVTIQRAKIVYESKVSRAADPKNRFFKRGSIKVVGTSVLYKLLVTYVDNTGKKQQTPQTVIMKAGNKTNHGEELKYDYKDKGLNSHTLEVELQNYAGRYGAKLYEYASFQEMMDGIPRVELINNLKQTFEAAIRDNIGVTDHAKLHRSLNFTFGFTNRIHTKPKSDDFSVIHLYYPMHEIWRSGLMEQTIKGEKKLFRHPDSALYIRVQDKIFIFGGSYIRYTGVKENPRTMQPQRQCLMINLNNFDPTSPTRKKVIEKKSIKIIKRTPISNTSLDATSESINSSMLKQESQKEISLVDLKIPFAFQVQVFADMPQSMALTAGVFYKGLFYIFGGCKAEAATTVTALDSAYCLNPKQRKWKKLKSMRHAKFNHSAVVYGDLIFIIGGVLAKDANENFMPRDANWTPIVEIFNPVNQNYDVYSIKFKFTAASTYNNEIFSNSCCMFPTKRDGCFLLMNGDRCLPYILDLRNRDDKNRFIYSYQAPMMQIPSPNLLNVFGNCAREKGPRLQQVFDRLGIEHNGYSFYVYAPYNEGEFGGKARVIYGDADDGWTVSDETDAGDTLKVD